MSEYIASIAMLAWASRLVHCSVDGEGTRLCTRNCSGGCNFQQRHRKCPNLTWGYGGYCDFSQECPRSTATSPANSQFESECILCPEKCPVESQKRRYGVHFFCTGQIWVRRSGCGLKVLSFPFLISNKTVYAFYAFYAYIYWLHSARQVRPQFVCCSSDHHA